MTKEDSKKVDHSRTCKKCGRVFLGYSESQVENNSKIHEMNCKPKNPVGRPKIKNKGDDNVR